MRPALRLLILPGCILVAHACSFLPLHRQSLPVEAGQLGGGLPSGYELHAVLTLARRGESREYLMALRTDSARVRFALMTLQGLPVYIVTGSSGAISVDRQLHLDYLLTPDMVVCYLLMIYGSSELSAQSSTGPGWQLEATQERRRFSSKGRTSGNFEVSYAGEAPWYSEVAVSNSWDDTRMVIRTLEWFDVLPE